MALSRKAVLGFAVLNLLPLAYGMHYFEQLPEQMAVHFDFAGNPDNYMSRELALFGFPIFLIAVGLISNFAYSLRRDPGTLVPALFGLGTITLVNYVVYYLIIAQNLGSHINPATVVQALLSVVILALGTLFMSERMNFTHMNRRHYVEQYLSFSPELQTQACRRTGLGYVVASILSLASLIIAANFITLVLLLLVIVVWPTIVMRQCIAQHHAQHHSR